MQITDLVYIDETGYHYSDYPAFLDWLQTKYRAIYGADIVLSASSQDGQFLAILAQAFFDTASVGASVYSSFSPSTAQGVGLSRVVRINGISRRIPTFSTVDLDIGGTVGTTIVGGIVVDDLNQKWDIPTVTIPISGTITVTAVAQDIGTVNAAANTVNRIFTPTRGWQTANNPLAATPGEPVESDASLRRRQTISTANPSLSVFEGTWGAVSNVSGVDAVRGYENPTGTTDGNGIPEHSISFIVQGGDAMAIAAAIADHKTPGTGTYGTTTEVVYDSRGVPNTINFYRPTVVPINCEVNITTFTGYTSGYATLIQAAVAEYINSIGIGNDVLFTKLYVPANLINDPTAAATFDIDSIEISRDSNPVAAANVAIAFNELANIDAADIVVNI